MYASIKIKRNTLLYWLKPIFNLILRSNLEVDFDIGYKNHIFKKPTKKLNEIHNAYIYTYIIF